MTLSTPNRRHFLRQLLAAQTGAMLGLHAAGHARAANQSEPGRPPNILFIISDDHGWGDLPANGASTEALMPTLDRMAARGVRFPNFHNEPLCGPSRACLFTGQFSMENGMWRGPGKQKIGEPQYRGVKRDVKMLSEFLDDAGYATGAFGKWHMGYYEAEAPNDRGFEEFDGFLGGAHPYWLDKVCKLERNGKPYKTDGHTTEVFTERAMDFIKAHAGGERPLFCYLSYNAVHGPLWSEDNPKTSAPGKWLERAAARGIDFPRRDYVAILEHMDHNIGRVLALLEELKIADETLVVFVSDNGACTLEEETAGHFPGNNGPLRGGKGTTWQGGLNVPCLMRWPGRFSEGFVSSGLVMHCDIFSTLLDAAGVDAPETNGQWPVRGMSLLPHIRSTGKRQVPERPMFFELVGKVGMRKGKYKLWATVESSRAHWNEHAAQLAEADIQLFDLNADPGETNNLKTKLPKVYESLRAELIDYFSTLAAAKTRQ